MRNVIRVTWALAAALVAACSQQPSMDEQMKLDLQAASAATPELAPRGGGTQVVSPAEQLRPEQPRETKVREVRAPAETKTPPTEPSANRPASPPKVSPPPPGGYKTMEEVLRKAPFPIKPATKRP
jgi:hypothetical protein